MEQWGFIVKQRKREQGAHQSFFFFIRCVFTTLSLPASLSYSHTQITKGWSAEKTKTMWPCIILSLVLRKTQLTFPVLKSGKFYRQIGKSAAVVVASLNQIQM